MLHAAVVSKVQNFYYIWTLSEQKIFKIMGVTWSNYAYCAEEWMLHPRFMPHVLVEY